MQNAGNSAPVRYLPGQTRKAAVGRDIGEDGFVGPRCEEMVALAVEVGGGTFFGGGEW